MTRAVLVLAVALLAGCDYHDEQWYRNDETIKLNHRAVQYLTSEKFKAMEPARRQGAVLALKAVILDPQNEVRP